MNRREALVAVGASIGYLYGSPVGGESQRALALVLDGLDAIVIQHRGQRIVLDPAEVVAALATVPPPIYQQQYRR